MSGIFKKLLFKNKNDNHLIYSNLKDKNCELN